MPLLGILTALGTYDQLQLVHAPIVQVAVFAISLKCQEILSNWALADSMTTLKWWIDFIDAIDFIVRLYLKCNCTILSSPFYNGRYMFPDSGPWELQLKGGLWLKVLVVILCIHYWVNTAGLLHCTTVRCMMGVSVLLFLATQASTAALPLSEPETQY